MITSKKKKFQWNKKNLVEFHKLKEILTSPPVLAYPNPYKQFFGECDANDYDAIGGLLSWKGDNGTLHPIYYYSKTLSKAEVNYSTTEKQLLDINTAFTKFQHLLQGTKRKIIVYSDHRNLLFTTKHNY
jgi:hypothetical protein